MAPNQGRRSMAVVGRVESLWRYPVKSMRGEELREAFLGFAGVCGDRIYAFRSRAAPKGFFCHTGREQEQILLGCPEHMAEQPQPARGRGDTPRGPVGLL